MTTTSERAAAGVQRPMPAPMKPQRVCCPSCEATFDLNKIGKPRSVEQHRRFWGIMKAAFHHWPEAHEHQFTTMNDLRVWLTMKAGWRDLSARIPLTGVKPDHAVILATAAMKAAGSNAVAVAHKGQLCVWTPKSIRFDKMKHMEFVALNQAVEDVINAEIGITGDELLEQAKQEA